LRAVEAWGDSPDSRPAGEHHFDLIKLILFNAIGRIKYHAVEVSGGIRDNQSKASACTNTDLLTQA
jgi:hypothetical protein